MLKFVSFLILSASFAFSSTIIKKDCRVSKVNGDVFPAPGGVAKVYSKSAILICGKENLLVTLVEELEPQILTALSGKLKVNVEASSTESPFWEIHNLVIY